jgi:hypothetical protein
VLAALQKEEKMMIIRDVFVEKKVWLGMLLAYPCLLVLTMWKDYVVTHQMPNILFYATVPEIGMVGSWHDKNCLIPYNWAKYTFVPSAHSLLHFSGFSRFIRGTKVAASRAYKFIMPVMHRIYHASNAQLEEYCCPFQMMQAISADDEER